MGNSFFTGTDAELRDGSQSFATKIAATPTVYGLTAPLATSYGTLNTAYRTAYDAAKDPMTRTKPKIQAKDDAAIALRAMATDLAKLVEGTATVTNEQKLDLGLSVRATPSPKPAPGTPSNSKVTLNGDGSLDVTFKCHNPVGTTGTMYQIWRRIGATGEFTYIGGVGQKKFTDATLPAGSAQVTYQIQAVRSTVAGAFAQFNVNFGVSSGGGAMIASVTEGAPAPIAA